jgi:UDP:flavonoid glycosyltransferase YjiC (YdhE family)
MIQWRDVGTIVISSTGTLGDYLPFIALGAELAGRGHRVRLAVNESVHAFVRALGLDPFPCGRRFGPEEARRVPHVFDHWRNTAEESDQQDWEMMDLPGHFRDLKAAARGADLLVASSTQGAASMVHEATGVPWATVFLMPWQLADVAAAERKDTQVDEETSSSLSEFNLWIESVRRSVGLSSGARGKSWASSMWSFRRLLAASRHFAQAIPEVAASFIQTGFLFLREPRPFIPDSSLAAFVDEPPGPIVIALSSVVVEDPHRFLAIHVEAARRAGLRLLIQSGWAGFSLADLPAHTRPENVRIEPFIPHQWLFAKAAAVVTHGGIGTIARALEAGCPLVVEPFGSDQIFNAARVKSLGAGVALHPHRITVESLTHTFRERVLAESVRSSARALGVKIASENGLEEAADAVEGWLRDELRPMRTA